MPSPTEAQLDKIASLYLYVASVGDALGLESSDSGQVLTLGQSSFDAARKAAFPGKYIQVKLSAPAFRKAFGGGEGVADLLGFIKPFRPEFALVGNPEWFQPKAQSRGSFWVCIFLHSKDAVGWNTLLRFQRVET
ncbi:MAG: hypothetical protein U0Q16_05370 [Bryobacteraceae bacterium]